jgi:hypothetical protein
MKTPNVSLMREYGTYANFQEKTANVAPIAYRIAEIALGRGILANHIQGSEHSARHTMQAEQMNLAFRMMELAKMEHAIDNANHTNHPIILPGGYGEDMPLGMTEGMIRMASVAGEKLANTDGVVDPYRTPAAMPPAPVPAMAANPARTGVSGMKLKSRVQAAGGLPKAVAAPVAAAAAPVAGQTADLAGAAKKMWDRTGLSNGRAPKKLLALGAFGVGTLGALKGLGYVKKKMEEETPPRSYGDGGNQLAPDVNEYGYAQPVANRY